MHRARVALQLLQRKTFVEKTFKLGIRNKSSKLTKHENVSRHLSSASSVSNQQAVAAAAKAEPFLSGSNSLYVEEMYQCWLENPNSVHKVPYTFRCVLLFNINLVFASLWCNSCNAVVINVFR